MTLRSRTSLILAATILSAYAITGTCYLQHLKDSLRASVFDGLNGVTTTSSVVAARVIEHRMNEAQAIAFCLPKEALERRDVRIIEEQLQAMYGFFPSFENGLFLLDTEGILWADFPVHPEVKGKSFAHREYYQRTMQEMRGIIGKPYYSARTGEPVLTFTALVHDGSGKMIGVLGCSMKLLSPRALGGLRMTRIGQSGYVYAFDSARTMILHPRDERVLKRDVPEGVNSMWDAALRGFEGECETVNSEGVPMLASIRRIPDTDWVFVAQQPQSEAYAPILQAALRLVSSVLLAVFVAILLGAFFIRNTTAPLMKLRDVALRIGNSAARGPGPFLETAGRLEAELEDIKGGDEIGVMVHAFHEMCGKLDNALRSLENAARDWERTFDSVADLIFILDQNNHVIRLNRSASDFLGKATVEVIGKPCRELFPTGESWLSICPSVERPEGKEVMLEGEREWTFSNRVFNVAVSPLLDERGNEIGAVHVLSDITERKKAEDVLKLNEMRLEALLAISHMSDFSPHGVAKYALEQGVRLTGSEMGYLAFASEDETILNMYAWSDNVMEGCFMEDRPLVYEVDKTGLWGEAMRQRRAVITNDYSTANPLKKGYPEGHVEIRRHMNVPIFDGARIALVAGVGNKGQPYDESDVRQLTLLMDAMWRILQRRNAEEEKEKLQIQLYQAQKMEAIGTLSGGIAHDFNNILAAIMGYTEMALHKLPLREREVKEDLEQVLKAACRARDLVKQILVFSRQRGRYQRSPVMVAPVIKEALKMLRASLPTTIAMEWNIACDTETVLTDPTQIHQIIVNLCTNAAHAMNDKGTLSVDLTAEELDHESARRFREVKPGRYLHLSVSDTGEGMSPSVMERIFDPYFTTKDTGKGTGLGLAVVQGIVKRHEGVITVESEPGKGARFHVFLPQADKGEKTGLEVSVTPSRGTGRILFVDDEKMIADIGGKLISQLGYNVRALSSSSEALDLIRSKPDDFDLLITDYTMPEMTGLELAREVHRIRPGLPVILCTGYSERMTEEEIVRTGVHALAMKPLSHEELGRLIASALANSPQTASSSIDTSRREVA
jgi:PAS domain S-box-containing protein